jgi:hypothetical protein
MNLRAPSCFDCWQFNAAPLYLEAALPGLSSLSSAFAAVRAGDGLCAVHDRYVAASSLCDRYHGPAGHGAHSASTSTRQS